jgi:hypothetical protein
VDLWRYLRGENHLHDPAYVAQVHEDETSVIPPAKHPPCKLDALAGIFGSYRPAILAPQIDLLGKPTIIAGKRPYSQGRVRLEGGMGRQGETALHVLILIQ